jgi:two-component sensor histidine kinase
MRLSTRITLLCAAAVLPSLGIQAWHEVSLRQTRLEEIRAEARRFALQSASEVTRMMEGARNMLTAVGEAHLRGGTYPGCAEGLAALTSRMPRYASIGVSDAHGLVVCSSSGARGPASILDRGYFQAARASLDFEVGAPILVAADGSRPARRVLPLALPFQSEGRLAGVAITSFDTGWLSANLVASGALPEGGSVTVADGDGIIVARFPQPEIFVGTRIPEAFTGLLRGGSPGVLDVVSQDGTPRVLGYVPLDANASGLYISAGFPTAPALAAADLATQRAVMLVLAGLLSAFTAAWLFGRISLRDPVDRLLDVMRRWTAGDHGARSDLIDGWEIGRLAAGFNAMADAVAVREQHLREGEARLRDVLGQMPVAVVLAEIPSGRIVFRNARAEALLPDGGTAEPGAVADPLAEPLRRAISEGLATEGLELPLRRADGSETILSVSAAPVQAAGGGRLAVAAFLDVGARRHAERQRELLTAELRHRVKNALAVVQSMVAQTLAQSTSLEEFRRTFTARLTLLARAQDALFASEDGSVRLEELVAITLAPFGAAARADGPDVALPAKQTLSLAMVLHEMATNAAKHGALRPNAGGHIAVTWSIRGDGTAETVDLAWAECSRLPIVETGRRGFGARLIERCVQHDLRGVAKLQAEPGGITWRISFPRPPAQAAALHERPLLD